MRPSLVLLAIATSLSLQSPAMADEDEIQAAMDAVRSDKDACGGEGLGDFVVPDGPFLAACKNHDACYHSGAKDQGTCDRDFLRDMRATCADRYSRTAKPVRFHSCNGAAYGYFRAVNSKFGSYAYKGGEVGGEIDTFSQRTKSGLIRPAQLSFCGRVTNTTGRIQEYDMQLRGADGTRIDTEPNLYQVDVQPGASKMICVNTRGNPFWSARNIGETYSIILRADNPDSFAPIDHMLVVKKMVCTTATGRCTDMSMP